MCVRNKDKAKVYMTLWREKNKERLKEYSIAYRETNKERIKKYNSLYHVEYRTRNREREIARSAAWAKENIERKKELDDKWYKNNKEYAKKRSAAWRRENPEKVKVAATAWHKAHPRYKAARYAIDPSKQKIDEHNRRVRKNRNGGKLSKEIVPKLLTCQKYKCSVCKRSLKKTGYHIDHIVPLIKGGLNEDRNIQLTCPTCNYRKSTKDPIRFMQELGYLL